MAMRPIRIEPNAGQESVWDYPRPPRLEPVSACIRVVFENLTIADSVSTYRVLETSHPPVYYIPPSDIQMQFLSRCNGSSGCEWKGRGEYYSIAAEKRRVERVAWFYPNPTPSFEKIQNYVAFYAGPMDACFVNDEKVVPQPGGSYGGWITSNVVGPFKGAPGSMGW